MIGELTSKRKVKILLKSYGFKPSKKLGQHFLVDKKVLEKIINSIEISKNDRILEIGPGIGVLTVELAKRAKKVIAIEKDSKMVEILKETVKNFKNLKIFQEDILVFLKEKKEIIKKELGFNYKVVGNIPYYLTCLLIRNLLELKEKPKEIILMVQKEVAQRICAKVPKMNLLAVSVQFYGQPKIISYVSKKSFWPQPKVDSAIIKITINKKQLTINKNLFFKIVKAGFSQPRKQLVNNLSKMLKFNKEKVKEWLLRNNIQPSQRAETLKINDWIKLTDSFPF